jgi:hypothetical protein
LGRGFPATAKVCVPGYASCRIVAASLAENPAEEGIYEGAKPGIGHVGSSVLTADVAMHIRGGSMFAGVCARGRSPRVFRAVEEPLSVPMCAAVSSPAPFTHLASYSLRYAGPMSGKLAGGCIPPKPTSLRVGIYA